MTKRDYNVDLFRIIATFLVVILHVLRRGGILENTTPYGSTYWAAWFLEIMAYCAVNCFALISGYVMENKTVKIKNLIGLWFQVVFYSILFSFCFFVFVPETRTLKNLVVAFMPVFGNQWWYISAYFGLFLFIPILNTAIIHMPKNSLKIFLIVILIAVGIIGCCLPIDAFGLINGYSPIWLIVLYLFGAYIKKYDIKQKTTALISILGFLAMVILTFLSKFIIHFTTEIFFGEAKLEGAFISYTSATIVLSSIFLFLFCLNIKVSNSFKKVISFLSPATLGVYLIHVHPFVFQYIIKDAFISFAYKPIIVMVMYVITASIAIFLLCSAIDLVRIQLFKFIKVNKLCGIIDTKITGLYLRVFKE